jgi:hypothetical protein
MACNTMLKRVEQMIEALKEMTGGRGSNLFLFADDASLRNSGPLNTSWISGKGSECRLLD